MKYALPAVVTSFLLVIALSARAETHVKDETNEIIASYIQTSVVTKHYSQSDEHRDVYMIGYEREFESGRIDGGTFFRNSFGQPTIYLYPWGKIIKTNFYDSKIYIKYSYGIMYGYKDKYEDKVPLNKNGFSPALIPALGYLGNNYQIQVNALGVAGIMIQFNYRLK